MKRPFLLSVLLLLLLAACGGGAATEEPAAVDESTLPVAGQPQFVEFYADW